MSARTKWHRSVRDMAEREGLIVERMTTNGGGHITCYVSLCGVIASATVPNSAGSWRTPMEVRAHFKRLVRSMKQNLLNALPEKRL